jgi:hypothetical protein
MLVNSTFELTNTRSNSERRGGSSRGGGAVGWVVPIHGSLTPSLPALLGFVPEVGELG